MKRKILFYLITASVSPLTSGYGITIINRTEYTLEIFIDLVTVGAICSDSPVIVEPKSIKKFETGLCCIDSLKIKPLGTPQEIPEFDHFQYRIDGCYSTTIEIDKPQVATPEGFGIMIKGYPS